MRPLINRAIRTLIFLIFALHLGHADANVYINVQPGDQTVSVGENVVFGAVVTTTGGEVITGYTWYMSTNNQSPFTTVGTLPVLSLNDVQVSNTGYYFANVSYESGGGQQYMSSPTVTLTVERQPGIATQPLSQTNAPGSNAVFSVTVGGSSPLHFQWQHNGSNVSDTGRITGSAGTNLDIENLTAADAGNYD